MKPTANFLNDSHPWHFFTSAEARLRIFTPHRQKHRKPKIAPNISVRIVLKEGVFEYKKTCITPFVSDTPALTVRIVINADIPPTFLFCIRHVKPKPKGRNNKV